MAYAALVRELILRAGRATSRPEEFERLQDALAQAKLWGDVETIAYIETLIGYNLYNTDGREQDALTQLRRALSIAPQSCNARLAWACIGDVQKYLGDRRAAADSYRKCLELDDALPCSPYPARSEVEKRYKELSGKEYP